MLHRIPWVLLLMFAIGWPLGAADESKKDAKPDETDAKPPAVKGKWSPVGGLVGQVKKSAGDLVTLTVEEPDIAATQKAAEKANSGNTAAQKQIQTFQNQLNAANRIKNPAQRLARVQQIQAQMQAAMMKQAAQAGAKDANFKMVMKKKDVDVHLASEVQVRVQDPPPNFDEKGVAKKYTAEELKKLKGPGNLWGYPGESDRIKPGAVLQVFLYRKAKKPAARTAPKGSLAPKDGDKPKDSDKDGDEEKPKSKAADDDDDDGTDPLVKIIYVKQEAPLSAPKAPPKKAPDKKPN